MIDRASPIPLHHQLYLELKEWFVREFTPGEALPTELVIADQKVADGWEHLPGSPLSALTLTERISPGRHRTNTSAGRQHTGQSSK